MDLPWILVSKYHKRKKTIEEIIKRIAGIYMSCMINLLDSDSASIDPMRNQ